MRASISKPTPFIYLAFEKTDPFIYLIIQNVDLFIYCSLIFCTHFFVGYYTNITVNSCNTKRISSPEKSLSEKYVHIPGCQKNGAFHIEIQKNRAIHIPFVEKRGPIVHLAVLKKGAIRHEHPYYAIYRKLPTPPPRANPLGSESYINNFVSYSEKSDGSYIRFKRCFVFSLFCSCVGGFVCCGCFVFFNSSAFAAITKICLFKYTEKFTTKK